MANIIVVLIFDEYKLTSESNGLNDLVNCDIIRLLALLLC